MKCIADNKERMTQMANVKKSITELVGKTPLLELVNYEKKYNH